MIHDSRQKYNSFSISKVISPEITLKKVLKSIKKINPPIFERYVEIKKKTGIPQYFIKGTERYCTFVNRIGRPKWAMGSNGKGYKKIHALVSGLMEMAERYSCNKHFIYKRGTTKVLPFRNIKHNYFGEKEFFSNPTFRKKTEIIDRNTWSGANIMWHEGQSLQGKRTLLPASLIIYMQEITNGMASGNSIEEALLHGLCEIIERHCKSYIRDNRITPPVIDRKSIKYRSVRDLMSKFDKINQEITLMDYSLDLGIPVIAAVRNVDEKNCVVTVGVAPHPEEAMARALTENSQGDNYRLKSYFRHLFKKSKTVKAETLPNIYDENIKNELLKIEGRLLKKDMRIWYIDTTDKVMQVPAVYVIVSNTRRNNIDLAYKNIIVGITEESLKITDFVQAKKYSRIGLRKDKHNMDIHRYFMGTIHGFNKDYKKSLESYSLIKNPEKLHEMKASLYLQMAAVCYLLGDNNKSIFYMAKNVRKFPNMKFIYLRPHHIFMDKKIFNLLKDKYEKLRLLYLTSRHDIPKG